MSSVAIIGGGISGLAIGFELLERGLSRDELVLLEAEERPGGNIRTDDTEGFRIEWGPNGFLDSSPPTLDLVRRLGIEDRILPSRETSAIRFIYRGGRLHEVPTGPAGMLGTGLLSLPGKLRIFMEPFIPQGGHPEETVFDFAARRIGAEAARVMVDSMVSGVFAGNARKLELRAAFPRMTELEADYGGLVKALLAIKRQRKREGKSSSGPAGPGGKLTSFGDGMEELIATLAGTLGPALRTRARVTRVLQAGNAWRVEIEGSHPIEAERVVLACPARVAAGLLAEIDDEAAALLGRIPSASISVVATAYPKEKLEKPPWGFGFLVPRGEGARILGCLWTSSIWEHRAPGSHVLLRTMVGGAHDPGAIELTDRELLEVVARDLEATMGITAEPSLVRIYRYRDGIPQYEPGHTGRLSRIHERLSAYPGLFIAGNSYGGIAVNHCVKEAPGVADAVVAGAGGPAAATPHEASDLPLSQSR